MYWWERRWLVVADVHFGKAATFRALGVPVPHGTTSDTLTRLTDLIDHLQPTTIVFLGDLFHAREAHAKLPWQRSIRMARALCVTRLVLVEGNHDRKAGATPAGLRIHRESDPWRVDTLRFLPLPALCARRSRLPGICIRRFVVMGAPMTACGFRASGLRWRDGLTVLPAFGGFTGGAAIDREEGDRVIAVAEDRVVEVPGRRATNS